MTKLNEQQIDAVEHVDGPLLIVAGAGTGKTTVITEKIAYLINEKKATADEILALTFTDKASGEMEERADKLLPYGYVDLWVMTFHSFCQRILQQHGIDIGISNDFKLLNQTEQWLLVRQNLDKFNLDYYRPLGNPTKFIHALIKHFSRCKDEEIWPHDYLEYAERLKINQDNMESTGGHGKIKNNKEPARRSDKGSLGSVGEMARLEEISNAYHIYQQLLLDNNSLDFGDLINYTLKLFKERPNILEKYKNQFKYILVDEFQDTNWAQYELVKLLLDKKQNLTVVGDDDQSIYKFRGASVSNILQFKHDFPKSKEIYLNKNYRSTQDILDLAYNFIQLNNPERLEVKLKTQGAINNKQGLNKKLESNTKNKGIIEHLHAETEQEEVEMVINKILELYNKPRDPSTPASLRSASAQDDIRNSWNDFAILVRANNQAESFINGLRNAEIPFNFIASKGLYSKEVILDILAYLKLLDNYHESMALWRILNLAMIDIKVEDLMQITNYARRKTISLFEACQQINVLTNIQQETKRKVNKILTFISQHTRLAKEKGVKVVVLKFLEDYNYQKYLLEQNNNKAFIYINQFINKTDEFEKSFDDKSVKNFMSMMDLEIESGEQGSLSKELLEGPESVKVMTIHSAKGLEFKYVFMVNLVDKRFPSMDRKEPIELPDKLVKEIIPEGDVHLQEERRLFYVAVTRAKQGVFFTSADDYGGARKKKLSRFLYEIGLESEKRKVKSEKQEYKNIKIQENKLPVTNYQLPFSFSYSQLKAFETCPYQYYLQYILKVPTQGKPVFSYGKTMHSTLQWFFSLIKEGSNSSQGALFDKAHRSTQMGTQINTDKIPSLDKLMELYQESWIDDWYESKKQKQDYKKQGEKSLKEFHKKLEQDGLPQVLELEKGFNFKIKSHSVRGVIDRIDRLDNDKIEIVDYKTGSAKTLKNIEKDQLLIYQMAIAEIFDWPLEKLTFYYLNNNSPVSFLGTDNEIKKQKNKMLNIINNIRKCDFTATPSQFKCEWCDFKGICQYKQR